MTVARSNPIAGFLDEKIYVVGGVEIDESDNWFEVFDVKTQTWNALPCHELVKPLKSSCVIENVTYICIYFETLTLLWYDEIWGKTQCCAYPPQVE